MQSPKYSLNIETEMMKCLDTGSSVDPDISASKSFACCNKGDEDEGDFLLFVVASTISDDKGNVVKGGGGVDMLWLDSESSTGYSKMSLMGDDSSLANQRAVHIEGTQVYIFLLPECPMYK